MMAVSKQAAPHVESILRSMQEMEDDLKAAVADPCEQKRSGGEPAVAPKPRR